MTTTSTSCGIMTDNDTNIELWNVHFDNDRFSYTYINQDKAIQSIQTFADLQIDDQIGNKSDIIAKIVQSVKEQLNHSCSDAVLMIMIGDARVYIKRITLDSQNPVIKTLISVFPQVNAETQKLINGLFTSPLCL